MPPHTYSNSTLTNQTHTQTHTCTGLLKIQYTTRQNAIFPQPVVWFLPREAMPSSCVCVCVCLCLSVCHTLRYCIKTAKRRIMQITSHDSPMTVFFDDKYHGEIRTDHPLRGQQMQVRCVKIGHFPRKMRYNSKIVKDRLRSHMRCIKWRCFPWPWVTPNPPKHPNFCMFRCLSYLHSELT